MSSSSPQETNIQLADKAIDSKPATSDSSGQDHSNNQATDTTKTLKTERDAEAQGGIDFSKQEQIYNKSELSQPAKERIPGKLSDQVVSDLTYIKKTRQELEEVRSEINQCGEDPKAAIPKLLEQNRILILGETHLTPNPMRDFGASIMEQLHKSGAKYLAVEIDSRAQPVLDEFMRTGKLTEELRNTLDKYAPDLNNSDYIAMLTAARKAGMKIEAVDKPRDPPPHTEPGQPMPFSVVKQNEGRDDYMAQHIELLMHNDPSAKVVFWVGNMHGKNTNDFVAQQLKREYPTATVASEIPGTNDPASELARGAREPIAVSTSKATKLGELQTDSSFMPSHYGDWDNIIIFPQWLP
ncbi:MAG TPA: hypothetical protein V6C69_10190 [Trichormus sp.]